MGNRVGNSHSLTSKLFPCLCCSQDPPPCQSTPISHPQTSPLLPDFHAAEPQMGGQPTPVIARDAVRFQQHLQLLKELWRQPGVGEVGFSEGRIRETQSIPHTHRMVYTPCRSQGWAGRIPNTLCRQQPKQPHLTCCMGVVERQGEVLPRILPLMPGI